VNTIELENILAWVSEEVEPELQLSTLRAFIFVATREKCTQSDVEHHLQTTNGSASRNVSFWTDRRADRKPGKDFIMRQEDDYDRRYKVLTLTRKGKAFWEKMKEQM
jgi:hypothetical protein